MCGGIALRTAFRYRRECPPGADPARGKQPKRTKYNNRRTELDGKTYDSVHEAGRAAELKLLVAAGEIAAVMEQGQFPAARRGSLSR